MAEINTLGLAANAQDTVYTVGKELKTIHSQVSLVAGSAADGDVYVLTGGLGVNSRIHRVMAPAGHGALTLAVDNDLGFYKKVDGVLVALDADVIFDGVSLASASAVCQDLLNKGSVDRTKTIGELLDITVEDQPNSGIFLCLTVNTKSSATFALDLDVVVEQV